jgi:hypothetical protein
MGFPIFDTKEIMIKMQTIKSVILFLFLALTLWAEDHNITTFQTFKIDVTMHSIGVEWEFEGDDNHDANCSVRYKESEDGTWKDAMGLYRVDFTPSQPQNDDNLSFNGLAGSILFLKPSTTYTLSLHLVDPDGGNSTKELNVTTAAIPQKPTSGNIYHVVPRRDDNSSGDGSEASPFLGIQAAQEVAQAGDTFLLHHGLYHAFGYEDKYWGVNFYKGGTKDDYILWKSAGDGDAILEYSNILADYIWLEGLQIRSDGGYGIKSENNASHVVISYNTITHAKEGIQLSGGGKSWWITNNDITGIQDLNVTDYPESMESTEGEGIELYATGGHTVANNTITLVGDGISSPYRNVDIYHNEIYNVTDDGIEPDKGYANIRIWENRISNVRHHGFSFQPMNSGPWYFIRNQIIAPSQGILKIENESKRNTSRALIAHNTFVTWRWGIQQVSFLTFEMKNNIWVALGEHDELWNYIGDEVNPWRSSLDYDGFDLGIRQTPFRWQDTAYANLADFQAGTGLELHAILLDHNNTFDTFHVSAPAPTPVAFQYLTLSDSSPAIDAGVVLANINDDFTGLNPDLGAFEKGIHPPHYGVIRPDAPTNLTFSDINETSVTLHWENTAEIKDGFKILRDGALIFTTDANTTTFRDIGLKSHTTYTYKVQATKL